MRKRKHHQLENANLADSSLILSEHKQPYHQGLEKNHPSFSIYAKTSIFTITKPFFTLYNLRFILAFVFYNSFF